MLLSQDTLIWGHASLSWVVLTYLTSSHPPTDKHLSDPLPLILAPTAIGSFFLSSFVSFNLTMNSLTDSWAFKITLRLNSVFNLLSRFVRFLLPPSTPHLPTSCLPCLNWRWQKSLAEELRDNTTWGQDGGDLAVVQPKSNACWDRQGKVTDNTPTPC